MLANPTIILIPISLKLKRLDPCRCKKPTSTSEFDFKIIFPNTQSLLHFHNAITTNQLQTETIRMEKPVDEQTKEA